MIESLTAAVFRDSGIAPNRLDLRDWPAGQGNRLTAYHRIDIALDPSPSNGMTTTCDALHMGVPEDGLRQIYEHFVRNQTTLVV